MHAVGYYWHFVDVVWIALFTTLFLVRLAARAEARLLSRILRIGLLLAILAQIGWSFRPTPSGAQTDLDARGRAARSELLDLPWPRRGGNDQRSLTRDRRSRRGRLHAAHRQDAPREPGRSAEPRRAEILPGRDRRADRVRVRARARRRADPQRRSSRATSRSGTRLFLNNCSGCHGAGASGDSVGGEHRTVDLPGRRHGDRRGRAHRSGPDAPVRAETIDQHELDSLAAYLLWLHDNGDQGLQLGRVGAVAEGLVAVVVGLGILVLVLRLTGAKR